MTRASDVTQFCPCCVELSLEVKASKGERKIYPGTTPPPEAGEYTVYSVGGHRTALYFDGDEWLNHNQYSLGHIPAYWEDLPQFDERFVVEGE